MEVNEKIDAAVRALSKDIAELKKIRSEMRELYIPSSHGQTLIDIFGNAEDKKGLENDKLKLKELQAQEKAMITKLESKKEMFNVSVFNLVKSLNSYVYKDVKNGNKDGLTELILKPYTEKGVVKCELGTKQVRNAREFVLPTATITGVKKHADKNEILSHGRTNIMDMMLDNTPLTDDFTKVYLNAIKNTLIKNAEEISKNTKTPSDTVRRLDEMIR